MRKPQYVILICLLMGPMAFQTTVAEDGKHLFILSGQSNMRRPLPDAFERAVSAVFGKDKVIIVTRAHPSQPIKCWFKAWQPPEGMKDSKPESNGKLYEGLLGSVQRAIKGKQIRSVTFIWMQGEADAGKGWGRVYESSFHGVLNQFKKDLGVENVNFVVGRINDYWLDPVKFPDGHLIRGIQEKLGKENANGDWINTDDLNRGVNPWGGFSFEDGHFPPPGYRVMGQRFAKKACLLLDPKLTLDPDIFRESFFDSASQVKAHLAVGKTIRGTSPSPKHNANGTGLAALTDGAFGNSEALDVAWIGFPPDKRAVEIIVDLGSEVSVNTVGINTLISSVASAEFPDKITYSVSADGKNFIVRNSRYNTIKFYNRKELMRLRKDGISPKALLLLTEQMQAKARYIKITIETGTQWVFLDEVIVNPSPSVEGN